MPSKKLVHGNMVDVAVQPPSFMAPYTDLIEDTQEGQQHQATTRERGSRQPHQRGQPHERAKATPEGSAT